MAKVIDSTNLGYLISKIKAAFWQKSETSELTIDATPTANSNNLVKSGGVKAYVDGATQKALTISSWVPSQASGDFGTKAQTATALGITEAEVDALYAGDYQYFVLSVGGSITEVYQKTVNAGAQGIGYDLCSLGGLGVFSTLMFILSNSTYSYSTMQVLVTGYVSKNGETLVTGGGIYNEVHPAIETTKPSGGFLPNVVYDLGTLAGDTTFALASPTDNTIANPYHWTFDTGSTAPTVSMPANLTWAGDGTPPTIEANYHYEIFVRNGYASYLAFNKSGQR